MNGGGGSSMQMSMRDYTGSGAGSNEKLDDLYTSINTDFTGGSINHGLSIFQIGILIALAYGGLFLVKKYAK